MEFSKNQKGNHVLTCLGYEYNKFRENIATGVITWRCRQNKSSSCKAFIKTNGGSIDGPLSSHSHDSCPQKAKAHIAMSKMKEDIQLTGATARNVIGKETIGLNEDVLAHLPKKSSIVRNLFRHRRGGGRLPNKNTPDVTSFQEKYAHVILHDSGEGDPDRILAIGDLDLLQSLNSSIIYGDITTDQVITVSCHLYTWHAKVGDCYPPCVYFLLRRRNLLNYNKMFQTLKDMLPNMAPRKILLDFDKVSINSARLAFPTAEIKACYFRLCQSIDRKISSVGLKAECESNTVVQLMLKSLASLAFVPSDEIKPVFETLASSFPDEENYNEVLTHFFYTYIEGAAGRDPKFPIALWNHREAAGERSPGTTDCCERFRDALNSLFRCSHPSYEFLLGGLETDLACHRDMLEKFKTGHPELKKKKCDDLHERLAEIVHSYRDEENKLDFLRRIANLQ